MMNGKRLDGVNINDNKTVSINDWSRRGSGAGGSCQMNVKDINTLFIKLPSILFIFKHTDQHLLPP